MRGRPLFFFTLLFVGAAMMACESMTKPSLSSIPAPPQALMNFIQEDPSAKAANQAPELYAQATKDMDKGDYRKALSELQQFLSSGAVTRWNEVALYNAGVCFESLKEFKSAQTYYDQVASTTLKGAPRLRVLALYRFSVCSEELGEDDLTLAALQDLKVNATLLPAEVSQAELPARYAGALAKVGQLELAQKYYRDANLGVEHLLQQNQNGHLPDWYAKTLLAMGGATHCPLDWKNFENCLQLLKMGQVFFLQAAETDKKPWSEQALFDLRATYQAYLNLLREPPRGDAEDIDQSVLLQNKKWDRAFLLIDAIDSLLARQLPIEQHPSPDALQIIDFLEVSKKSLQQILEEKPLGQGLTSEALERRNRGLFNSRAKSKVNKLPKKNLQDPNL